MNIVNGIWIKNQYHPYPDSEANYKAGIARMTAMAQGIMELTKSFGGDWDAVLEFLGVADALQDAAEFTHAYDRVLFIAEGTITREQYAAYQWLCAVLKHVLIHGDVIWDQRTILLDWGDSHDWLVQEICK